MNMVRKGLDHDHAWLYEHGLGDMSSGKALARIMNVRAFKTSKGTMMASVYVWDGKAFHKVVIFPYLYNRYAQKLSKMNNQWVAIKPAPISKTDTGYKVDGAEDIIGNTGTGQGVISPKLKDAVLPELGEETFTTLEKSVKKMEKDNKGFNPLFLIIWIILKYFFITNT